MTDAPSPPFALPLRFEEETDHDIFPPDYGWIWDADNAAVILEPVYKPMALAIIRAVNSCAKMREAFNDIEAEATALIGYEAAGAPYSSPDDIPNGLRTTAHIKAAMIRELARTILKEIDNG